MPILDVGYRNWEGQRTPRWTRAAIVASTGIHLVWQGTWLKRVLLFMVVPAAVAAFLVGTFEQTIERPEARSVLQGTFRSPAVKQAAKAREIDLAKVLDEPETLRHFSWSYVLFGLLRYPQSIGMIVLIGLVAPRLISYDLRSRGYLLYLSRPLTPLEYVLGKAGVVYFLLFMMSAVPALLVYIVGLFLSTDPWAISHTWDLPLRILAAALVLILPTTAVALALSSLTQESRFAGFAWFAIWVLGSIAFRILWAAEQARNGGFGPRGRRMRMEEMESFSSWMLLSPYDTLGNVQQQIFGLVPKEAAAWSPWVLLAAVSIIGYTIAYRRVAGMLKA